MLFGLIYNTEIVGFSFNSTAWHRDVMTQHQDVTKPTSPIWVRIDAGASTQGEWKQLLPSWVGGIKFPQLFNWILPGLNSMGKEILWKYKKWGTLKNQKTNYNYSTHAFTLSPFKPNLLQSLKVPIAIFDLIAPYVPPSSLWSSLQPDFPHRAWYPIRNWP